MQVGDEAIAAEAAADKFRWRSFGASVIFTF